LPTADERDQAVVMDAYREVKGFVADYPEAKETEKIRDLLTDVTARLVRHELYVARFYLNRGNFEAAVGRILYALRNFGGAEGDEAEVPQDPEHEAEVPRGRGARGVRDVEARGGTSRPPKVASDAKLTLRRTAGHIGSGLEPEALLLLGETYLKMKKPPEAKEAFEAIVRDYPQSPIVEQAKNYLGFIGTAGGANKGAQGG
jgi:outer membrane protein assembly factor BamD